LSRRQEKQKQEWGGSKVKEKIKKEEEEAVSYHLPPLDICFSYTHTYGTNQDPLIPKKRKKKRVLYIPPPFPPSRPTWKKKT
jgi:hypothetical protein